MSDFVPTDVIKQAVAGRETDVLDGLGIPWRGGCPHIRCPYPDHGGDADWRWDDKKRRAFCTCSKGDDIFGVVRRCLGVEFVEAKIRVAELLGRSDLVRQKVAKSLFIKHDAESLLAAPAVLREDALVASYLGYRLGVVPDEVLLPSTRAVGLKALGYFDPPPPGARKPVSIGDFPCLVFETRNPAGDVHAQRIYVAPGGAGKADLGIGSDLKARDPKKSVRKDNKESRGHGVYWGDPARAPRLILAEGIETAQAAAQAFADDIERKEVAVAAGISANGVTSFDPWPANLHITIAADRDDITADGRPGSKAGEKAARRFALKHHEGRKIQIALPGCDGEKRDWLDDFIDKGAEAVRAGVLAAEPFAMNPAEKDEAVADEEKKVKCDELRRLYPLPYGSLGLFYDLDEEGRPWVYRMRIDKKTGEKKVYPICSPMGIIARLRFAGIQETYGLRIAMQDMGGEKLTIDLERGSLARTFGGEARERLLAAGLRVHGSGESVVVELLKLADPADEILVLRRAGWHWLPGCLEPLFACPDGRIIGGPAGQPVELASSASLQPVIASQGDLNGWQKAIAAAMAAPGCPHWTVGALTGFAGPLISLMGGDSCGINFSGLSSSGKTTAQRLAASVWGRPVASPDGLFQSALTTLNSLEAVAARSTGSVLVLDELAHVAGRDLGAMIYKLAGGVGKQRMTPDARLQESHTWATFVVFSAESSLEEKIRADDQKWTAGMAVRFIDVDVTGVNRTVDADTMLTINGVKQHFGHAGHAFVESLVAAGHHRDPDALRTRIGAMARHMAGPNADSARIRAAATFALLRVAGELAQEAGILPATDIGAVVDEAWRRYLDSSDAQALDPATQAIDNIRQWIAERWGSSIHDVIIGSSNRDSQGWYDRDCVYLPPDRVVEAAGGVLKEREIAKLLKAAGFIVKTKDVARLTYGYVPLVGEVKTYALSRHHLGRSDVSGDSSPHEPPAWRMQPEFPAVPAAAHSVGRTSR